MASRSGAASAQARTEGKRWEGLRRCGEATSTRWVRVGPERWYMLAILVAPPYVGASIPRVDGAAKVRGAAMYVDDIVVPGALHGGTVRSTVARGRLRGIKKDPRFDWSGIV